MLDLDPPLRSHVHGQYSPQHGVFAPKPQEVAVNKSDLVDAVASGAGVDKRQAEGVLNAFFDEVKTAAKRGDKIAWPGFGSFSQKKSAARTGRNPQTGAPVKIKASTGVKFTPSSSLKEFMNTKGSAKKAAPKKAAAKKTAAKKATPKKAAAKKTAAKKGGAKKGAAKKAAKKR
jgi:DNA-binding protein HU-beta